MDRQSAQEIAKLHAECIPTGFISSLGSRFVSQLYAGIAGCRHAFCLVAVEHGHVVGFIAGAESVGRVYKSVILRRGLFMLSSLLRFVFSGRTIRKIFQTLLYPSRSSDYPAAEILSVAVASDARRKGIGTMLMRAALEEFERRGISEAKLAVAADNAPANRYYLKEGFHRIADYDSHGVETNIYVRNILDGSLPIGDSSYVGTHSRTVSLQQFGAAA